MEIKKKAFAEVIESSLQGWTAQSWQWNTIPEFGSLVAITTKNRTLFGVIYQSKTGSIDSNHYPFAYKKTEEELLLEQPHIFDFLQTTFSCILVGFNENGKMIYRTAPEPAPIHGFIIKALAEDERLFFKSEHYLHLLFGASDYCNIDELLLALLHYMKRNDMVNEHSLSLFLDTFSILIGNDYKRLKLFLQRAQECFE